MISRKFNSKVLVTGATGQLGSDFVHLIQTRYGLSNVMATDIKEPLEQFHPKTLFQELDVTEPSAVKRTFSKFKPSIVYHFASILSLPSEKDPQEALRVNMQGLHHVLEASRDCAAQLFAPSSIAAFGPGSPAVPGDLEVQDPLSIYGITKVHLELMCRYYYHRYRLDTRVLRVPIVVSEHSAGAGAAGFTVSMFQDLIKTGKTVVPLSPETTMPLIYLPDLYKAIEQLMATANEKLQFRCYTPASVSTTVREYCEKVLEYIPGTVEYKPDARDAIVKNWPSGTNAKQAAADWGNSLEFDMKGMVMAIYKNLKAASSNI